MDRIVGMVQVGIVDGSYFYRFRYSRILKQEDESVKISRINVLNLSQNRHKSELFTVKGTTEAVLYRSVMDEARQL